VLSKNLHQLKYLLNKRSGKADLDQIWSAVDYIVITGLLRVEQFMINVDCFDEVHGEDGPQEDFRSGKRVWKEGDDYEGVGIHADAGMSEPVTEGEGEGNRGDAREERKIREYSGDKDNDNDNDNDNDIKRDNNDTKNGTSKPLPTSPQD
jgi:hypothetical protein